MKKKTQLIILLVPVLIILTGIIILMILKPNANNNRGAETIPPAAEPISATKIAMLTKEDAEAPTASPKMT